MNSFSTFCRSKLLIVNRHLVKFVERFFQIVCLTPRINFVNRSKCSGWHRWKDFGGCVSWEYGAFPEKSHCQMRREWFNRNNKCWRIKLYLHTILIFTSRSNLRYPWLLVALQSFRIYRLRFAWTVWSHNLWNQWPRMNCVHGHVPCWTFCGFCNVKNKHCLVLSLFDEWFEFQANKRTCWKI
jgi:hypothetical protein